MVVLALAAGPANAAGWDELEAIAADADSASKWADLASKLAKVAHKQSDTAVEFSDSVWTAGSVAEILALRDSTIKYFESAYYTREETSQAWRRANRASRRALEGRNAASDSPLLAWQLEDPYAVIAYESFFRAKEASCRAAAWLSRAVDAESSAYEAVLRAKRRAAQFGEVD